MARSPMVTFERMVAPDPMEAPFLTSVVSTVQSRPCSCSSPDALVALG